MRSSMKTYATSAAVGIAVSALLVGCAGPSSDAEGDASVPSVPVDGEVGPAEVSSITFAIPFPDVTMTSRILVGTALGYFEEEGLSVEVITAQDVNAALSSGSADIGIVSSGAAVEALRTGVAVDVLSGALCRDTFSFAVQPDVDSVADLAGSPVVLAGTAGDPKEAQRARVLAEEGWDLDSAGVEVVYPGPGSDTWREFFVNDRVDLMPFYGDDRAALEEYGANVIVETIRDWPGQIHVAGQGWLEANPNAAIRFLRANMKAAEYIVEPGIGEVPENLDSILDIYEDNDLDVSELEGQEDPWVLDGQLLCPNMYFSEDVWDTIIETQDLESLDFESNVDLSYLLKAQEMVGLDNNGIASVIFP